MASSSKEWTINVVSDSYVTAWNSKTREIRDIGYLCIPGTFQFLDSIPRHFDMKNVKVVVFSIFDFDFRASKQIYDFRLRCREFCQKYDIIFYFPSMNHSAAIFALSKTQTMVDEGEIVLLVISVGPVPGHAILKRENGRYNILSEGKSKIKPFSPSWKSQILGNFKPKKIILMKVKEEFLPGPTHDISKMKKLFKNQNIQIIYPDEMAFEFMASGEIAMQLMNEKGPTVYDVAIHSLCKFEVRLGRKVIVKVTEETTVPFEESVIVNVDPKSSITLYCKYEEFKTFEAVKEIKCSNFKSKKVKITLKIDYNSFDDLKVEPIKDENEPVELEKDPKILDSGVSKFADDQNEPVEPEKARFMFDKQNFCVSYFADGNENILKDKDGLDKTPIYISFVEEKPIIGEVAKESFTDKPGFVVFDLIKLSSTTGADIINPQWGFGISMDENETLMVEMQTLEGEKKGSVAFLLALFLKNGISRIKKEYGKKMKEIEVGFDGFQPNETLKKNFIEAGNLLKIGIVFV